MSRKIGVNLRVTGNCNQGGRKYMEDMFCVAYQETYDKLDLEYAFCGIFDGHGGNEAALYAKQNIMKNIAVHPGFWSDSDAHICEAMKAGFLSTHYAMWKRFESWPKTQSGLPSTSGTTASVVFIKNSKLYVGHVGDSGAILGREGANGEWDAVPLTDDHKPEMPKELKRIQDAGGEVTIKAGIHRVVWKRPKTHHQGPLTRSAHFDNIPFLAVARSLGDLWSYNADSDQFLVSPIPDIRVHDISPLDRCIILGTDGLFNMLSAQEAVDIVAEAERNNKNCLNRKGMVWANPSKYLVDHAITKWMDTRLRADNTSAVVIFLDPPNPPGEVSSTGYTVAKYEVKDGKCRMESEPTKKFMTPWEIPPLNYNATTTRGLAPLTLRGLAEHYSGNEYASTSKDSTTEDSVKMIQDISLEEKRNKKAPKRQKKIRETSPAHTVGRRKSFMSDRDLISAPVEPMRTRRTRSEEPVRIKARRDVDAENVGAPMRLRSTDPFKTLRSRNVNLKTPFYFHAGEEPRSKRVKK